MIANTGLAYPDFVDFVLAQGDGGPLETMIVVPAPELGTVAERRRRQDECQKRLDWTLIALVGRGAWASGSIADETNVCAAFAQAMIRYSADEVVLAPGNERGWREAVALAFALHRASGIGVSVLGAAAVAGELTEPPV